MKSIEISGVSRAALGKKNSLALRAKGLVPCNLYGNGENVNLAVEVKNLQNLLYTPNAYLVQLNIEGKPETAVLREVQFHPVSDAVLHIDFFRVDNSKPIAIDVPVELKGNAEGVKLGGKLQQLSRKITISALPQDLPDSVVVDVTNLGLGKSIFVGDITLDKVNVLTPKNAVVCAVKMTRAALGAAATAAPAAAAAAAPAAAEKKEEKKSDKKDKKK
ncbi:50S ribosomal protein L25 [Bacteroidia bacterium]|nr:50S ribosomal protein L25 [Bacteroidia bacterium]GHU94294.1 50S ribosomal protein L25 [Bacteroidia bacterium]